MIYLLLAILSSASIALILKFSENRGLNRFAVTSANYVAAFSVSLFLTLRSGNGFSVPAIRDVYAIGIFAGILYFLGFIYILKSIKQNGVGLTGAVSKTGIILPVLLSMILWKEVPGVLQSLGVLLSLSAMILINLDIKDIRSFKSLNATLILLFLIAGTAEFTTKLFERYCIAENKPLYLFIIFFSAFWISAYFTFSSYKKGGNITKTDIVTGLFVGIPNMFASFFLIESLRYYKASIAFPAYSSGTIVLINIGGILIFKEKLSRKNALAVGMIIVAIVMMNM